MTSAVRSIQGPATDTPVTVAATGRRIHHGRTAPRDGEHDDERLARQEQQPGHMAGAQKFLQQIYRQQRE
jgi:hypothetical protein